MDFTAADLARTSLSTEVDRSVIARLNSAANKSCAHVSAADVIEFYKIEIPYLQKLLAS